MLDRSVVAMEFPDYLSQLEIVADLVSRTLRVFVHESSTDLDLLSVLFVLSVTSITLFMNIETSPVIVPRRFTVLSNCAVTASQSAKNDLKLVLP